MRGPSLSRVARRARRLLIVFAAGVVAGCSTVPPPHPPTSPLESQRASEHDPYGASASIEVASGTSRTEFQGELVAADRDSLFAFHGDSLRSIPAVQVTRVTVVRYQGQQPVIEKFASWNSPEDRAKVLRRLSVYARFPQGLSADVDRATLHPRR